MSTVRYDATITVVIPQLVHCFNCDCKFIYEQTITGIGRAESGLFTSEQAARKAAEKDAKENLDFHLNDRERLFDAIPCRQCYHYQPYMHHRLGQNKYDDLGCAGYLLNGIGFLAVVGAIIAWFFLPEQRQTLLWVGVGGLSAFILGYVIHGWIGRLIARNDPNAERLNERMKCASARTMTLEDYDDLQGMRLRRVYTEHVEATRVRPWQKEPSNAEPDPLIVEWWVVPSLFLYGGMITFKLSDDDHATVVVPEDAKPGTVFDLETKTQNVTPFQVRVLAINVHDDEQRLE